MAKPILMIDAGHGGTDPGAIGNQMQEKDLTLQISLYQLQRCRELNLPVAITRTTDTTLTPSQRTTLVKQSGATYCISNHINSGGGEGVEAIHSIFTTNKLANALAQAVAAEGQKFRRVYTRVGADGRDYYFMHRETGAVDTIIMEYGFIDHAGDAQKLKDNWKRYAEAVIKAFCGHIGHPYSPAIEEPSDDFDLAVDALVQAKIITSPDYWKQNAVPNGIVVGDYATQLIKNMANYLKAGA
ncbi:N-acetylmuramoyl-L-alanine amidase [Brevibacillus laterosporus]|uniref:N-acetylmuramoyl-L-alanine amidase n=1 Tax=Brevibacillus laterosporus TaxID=1465 RepID=UPI0018CDC5D8|nr:N-acetylmuramoyl-L-alanine amidase [Brevibacillus laterosporus]MBG9789773.1 N-acetylmuramoyl-L-alanine amidase [Brevibacillus laterosporus]MCG7318387.1 N-acetylmuramoyl-L-alanine amidase [Brevibacillus laterosporus]